MSTYLTVLNIDDPKIDKDDFIKWLDSKDASWWIDEFGIDRGSEYEGIIRNNIDEKINEVNDNKAFDCGGDVGCIMSLCRIISIYLVEEKNAVVAVDKEIYEGDYYIIGKK